MTIRFKRRMTWHHDHLPKVVHTPDIGDKHTLDFQNVRKRYSKRVRKKKKISHLPYRLFVPSYFSTVFLLVLYAVIVYHRC